MRDKTNDFIQLMDKLLDNEKLEKPLSIDTLVISEIKAMTYFIDNPENLGQKLTKMHDGKLIWAFVDHNADKTVVLLGRHGGVMFKTGLVTHLTQLNLASSSHLKVNVLFVSAPQDYSGVIDLLHEISDRYALDYSLAISPKLLDDTWSSKVVISTGSMGKVLPILVAKGMKTHTDSAYCGLNSISIMMEIVKAIELNTEMGDVVNKRMTPPPTFIRMDALGEACDDSTPAYSVATFNWFYLKDNLSKKLEQLRELCKWSMEDAINQFNYSYNEYLRKQSKPSYCECMDFDFEILLYDELIGRLNPRFDLHDAFVRFVASHENLVDHDLSSKWIAHLIELLDVRHPVVVIGILSPFYPVMDSEAFFSAHVKGPLHDLFEKNGHDLVVEPFYMGMSEATGLTKDIPGLLLQFPEFNRAGHVDFNAYRNLGIEVLHVGVGELGIDKPSEIEVVNHLYQTIIDSIT